MKTVSEGKPFSGPNAWGAWTRHVEHDELVETSDVGTTRPHYLGFGHRHHKFLASDVGRVITVYTDASGWTCWAFK